MLSNKNADTNLPVLATNEQREVLLTVITNRPLPIQNRSDNSNNRPELRQQLILDAIQKSLINCDLIYIDTIIEKNWLRNIHDSNYLNFLENAYLSWLEIKDQDWCDDTDGLIPNCFTYRIKSNKVNKIPIYKLSGYYCTDTMSPIYETTYKNAMMAANQCYRAAEILLDNLNNQNKIVYVLTSCPGHHAKYDQYAGYCFINNAYVAAYRLIELGKSRITILDLDYHSGTHDLIEQYDNKFENKIFSCSIHADPILDYPSFEGFADDNTNNILNIPLKGNVTWTTYQMALNYACEQIKIFNPEVLIIAFGADTFKLDPDASPLCQFKLELEDYDKIGQTIRNYFPNTPILITQEGGYNLEYVPNIICRFLNNLFIRT